MSTNTKNRTTQQVGDQKLIDGLNKHAQTIPSLVIGGTSLTTAAIIGILQARLATANAAQSTRATWLNAAKADKDERAKTKAFMSSLRQALHVAFDGSIDALADFGLVPPRNGLWQRPRPRRRGKRVTPWARSKRLRSKARSPRPRPRRRRLLPRPRCRPRRPSCNRSSHVAAQ